MSLSFRYSAHSEVGLVRKSNQDSGYVSQTMLMVADGMGGAAAGDLASAVAIRHLKATDEALATLLAQSEKRMARHTRRRSDEPDATAAVALAEDPDDTAPEGTSEVEPRAAALLGVLGAALAEANDQLADLVADDAALEGMGTTVCGFVLVDDALAVVNIGDSRAYLLRDGQLRRVTRDHSWVQTLVDEGRITEAEALGHPHRSLILKVLNGNPQHRPDLGFLDVKPGDRLLICSDGLCGLVTDAQIARFLGGEDRDETVDRLVTLARDAGGYDNITIVLADLVEGPPQGVAQTLGAATTTTIPSPSERTAALPAVGEPAAAASKGAGRLSEEDRYAPAGRRGMSGWAKMLLAVLLPLLVLGGAGWGWFRYTQAQFYVGPAEELVAIYQGVPDRILGAGLSHVVRTDTTRIGDLPPYYAERVRQNIKVDDLAAADSTLEMLRGKAAKCVAQREARARAQTPPPASPSPAVIPTVTLTPGAPASRPAAPTASASPGASPSPTPSPTQTQVTTPEDC